MFDLIKTKEIPETITVKDDTVPHFIKEGEPAPFEGVILSKPLFIEYAPCFERPPIQIPVRDSKKRDEEKLDAPDPRAFSRSQSKLPKSAGIDWFDPG